MSNFYSIYAIFSKTWTLVLFVITLRTNFDD